MVARHENRRDEMDHIQCGTPVGAWLLGTSQLSLCTDPFQLPWLKFGGRHETSKTHEPGQSRKQNPIS